MITSWMLLYHFGLRHLNTKQIFFTCMMSAGSAGCVLTAVLFDTTVHSYQSPELKSLLPGTEHPLPLTSDQIQTEFALLCLPSECRLLGHKNARKLSSVLTQLFIKRRHLERDWPGGSVGWTLCRTSMNSCLFYLQEDGEKRGGS